MQSEQYVWVKYPILTSYVRTDTCEDCYTMLLWDLDYRMVLFSGGCKLDLCVSEKCLYPWDEGYF